MKDNIAAVKQHIAAKSDINEKEKFGGSTPLISASLFGKTEIAKLLIDAGANSIFKIMKALQHLLLLPFLQT